jgi:hypothetical protein
MAARSLWRIVATVLTLLVALALPACAVAFETLFQDINPSIGLPGTSGAGWGDYDGDGYPDLLLSASPSFFLNRPDQLFHNNGNLTFTDVSATAGISPTIEESQGVAWGDYDNDGFLDAIIGCGAAPTKLYDNSGGHFTEVATAAGLNLVQRTGRTVAWCDFDGDNWLDVFVCNALSDISALFHNNQDGTFTDVTAAAGMLSPLAPDAANDCSWVDYNNDGYPDLVVSRGSVATAQRPLLYRNKGDGTFGEVAVSAGLNGVADTLGVAWLDYDNDGWPDLYFDSEQHGRDWLFHNNHDGTFTDVSDAAGMAGDTYKGNSVACADYDNDGFEDIFVGNTEVNQPFLYHSNGDGTFTDVAQSAGLGGSRSNLVAIRADLDLDGKMDLFVADATPRLFHNVGQTGNWLRVRALTSESGDATGSDPVRDAIGAVVSLSLDNAETIPTGAAGTLMRVIDGGGGYQGQHEPIAQFGIGSASTVSVRVRFPDGSAVIHRGVAANQQITIKDVPADYTETFKDVPLDYWAYPQVRAAYAAGIVKGSDGSYFPTNTVTRDQLAVYIARAMNGGDPTGPATVAFTDITNPWANVHIAYCVANNVVRGFDATHYGPTLEVDRGSMAVFIARAKGWVSIDDAMNTAPELFADVPAGYWSGTAVQACVDHGVVNGYDATHYQPTWFVSRDQMAVFVTRAFNLPT